MMIDEDMSLSRCLRSALDQTVAPYSLSNFSPFHPKHLYRSIASHFVCSLLHVLLSAFMPLILTEKMNALKQIVLISGANQGIGFEIAKKLASENPSYHILMGTRSLSKGQAAVASLPVGLSVQPLELDITSDASISRAHDSVAHEFGRLDVLINNA